tara:strand:- start:1056 stop:1220 length:165 start_codon:yes stop_codon:yes gene_type:complete
MTTIDRELHDDFIGLIEDTVEYFCNENMVSGEMAWIIMQCYATAKTEQFKGNVK